MSVAALADALRQRQLVLFVGAGLSQSMGLPGWQELIDHMADELGYDPAVFHQYGDYLSLAEYFQLERNSLGGLRSWMDRTWHGDETKVDTSRSHQAIVSLKCPTIFTTNCDRWLEIAFGRRGVKALKIANVGDFTKIVDGQTQIIKLHGDFDDDSSLVLTETSYFERLMFDSPLDIKLRADIIGKSVLFVGYSLSDINIRYLLHKVQKLWSDSSFKSLRPRSYIVLTRPNPVQESVLESRGITPLIVSGRDLSNAVSTFLEHLAYEAHGVKP